MAEWIVDLLYGDEDGGQRVIGRFRCQPTPWAPARGPQGAEADGDPRPEAADDPRPEASGDHRIWMLTVARHWSLDRPDPRRADRDANPA